MTGIREESNIDVLCVGASGTFVYWEPFRAWQDYGIVSYDLATNSLRVPLLKNYIKYAEKHLSPKLYIVDVSQFYIDDSLTVGSSAEAGIRNMVDSLDYSCLRLKTIHEIMKYYNAYSNNTIDVLSYYFDIAKYHSRIGKINEKSLSYADNRNASTDKGFEFVAMTYKYLDKPEDFITSNRIKLSDIKYKYLIDLLDYCKTNGLNVLFVVTPRPIDADTYALYSTVGDVISSYGYKYLNCDDYYDEIGLDFSRDFYDEGHVNVYGAERYTHFMADYITANYELTDHRGDIEYSDWDEYLIDALEKDKYHKQLVDEAIEEYYLNSEEEVRGTKDAVKNN